MLAQQAQELPREIAYRTRGHVGGPITRLASPSDLGQLMKPFVFLDRFVFKGQAAPGAMEQQWHPHSGIATVTVVFDGAVQYAETTGKSGVVRAGGIEWMQAGGGVWHTGGAQPEGVTGFQLWVALPPELENAPNASHYVTPEQVPVVGPARVILGEFAGAKSPIASPPLTYLAVILKAGESWSYQPPAGHAVGWVAVLDGELQTAERISRGELVVFEPSEQALDFVATTDTRFVLGSAPPHPHDLVLGNYSVHTSALALRDGETEIRRIGKTLRDQGKDSYALRQY